MIETYVDFARGSNLLEATDNANEMINRNEEAGWNMIQCQMIHLLEEEDLLSFIYSAVFQRTKEVVVSNYEESK